MNQSYVAVYEAARLADASSSRGRSGPSSAWQVWPDAFP